MAANGLPSGNVAAAPADGLRGARVLLVDDSDIIRDVTRSLLEDAGIIVEEAADGAAAVAMMREHGARCQLILMDVQMPVMDGIAATRAILAELRAHAPPIVAMTGQATAGEKHACLEAGMCDHLSKPVDPHQLLALANRWLAPLAQDEAGTGVATGAHDSGAAAQQALPPVPGFDLDAGLSCMGGKTELLRSQLIRFGSSYADAVAQLHQHILAQNYRDARRFAHTLKGAAATLGGSAIAQRAGDVEQLMLQMAEPAPGSAAAAVTVVQMRSALAELETVLARALPAMRAMAEAQADSGTLPVAGISTALAPSDSAEYEALRELLAGNCYAARKAFTALRNKLGADDAAWRAAAAAVDVLDFGQALAHLDARYPANIPKP